MNHRAYEEDLPLVLPMYYDYPEAEEAYQVPNQYTFGTQLLCAPITTPQIQKLNVGKVKVWLPEGTYYDVFTGMRYQGGRMLQMYRNLTSFAVLPKAGAIIPMTEELDSIQKNPEKLCIHVYPGGDGSFVLYEDDNETEAYKEGKGVKTPITFSWNKEEKKGELVIFPGEGCLELLPKKRSWKVIFHGVKACEPESISCQGSSSEWTYDQEKASLCCCLKDCDPAQEIRILVKGAEEEENHISERCFEFLNQAEIGFELKDRLYRTILEGSDRLILLSQLQTMDLDPDLLGALTEIITA